MKKAITILVALALIAVFAVTAVACDKKTDTNSMSNTDISSLLTTIRTDFNALMAQEEPEVPENPAMNNRVANAAEDVSEVGKFTVYMTDTRANATASFSNAMAEMVIGASEAVVKSDDFVQGTIYRDKIDMFKGRPEGDPLEDAYVSVNSTASDRVTLSFLVSAASGMKQFLQAEVYKKETGYIINCSGYGEYGENNYIYALMSCEKDTSMRDFVDIEFVLNKKNPTSGQIDAASIVDAESTGVHFFGFAGEAGLLNNFKDEATMTELVRKVIIDCNVNSNKYDTFKARLDEAVENTDISDWYGEFRD